MEDTQHTDEALMLLYKQGDNAAFENLYRRYKDVLFRYFIKYCGDSHQSEELYQDVWIKVIKAASRYEPKAKFKTYIFTIAHNTLIDFYRKSKPEIVDTIENAEMNEQSMESTVSLALPEDEFTLKQKAKLFMQALQDLPASQKEVAILYLEQDLSVQEIAEITQVNMETAKSRLRYAKNKLKAAIIN